MGSSLRRRRFIAATVTGATGLLTGCTGGGDDGNETDGGTNSSGDGSDSTDDGTVDGDGSMGDGTEDGTDSSGDGDGDEGGDGTEASNPNLGESFVAADGFAFDGEVEGEQQASISGRFSRGDSYIRFESEEAEGEFYLVGDNQYLVTSSGGESFCIQNPDRTPPGEGQIDPGEYESTVSEHSDVTPTGTTTIDGEGVYVYEFDSSTAGQSGTVTYYVSVNSGYIRRVETEQSTFNFHSWNDVDPIEGPDVDCQDMSGMAGGPGMPSR